MLYFAFICLISLPLSGCSGQVRHINSDVCLVKRGNSAKEVMDILGPPNSKTSTENGELWTYYTARKSPLKRTPGLNLLFGSVSYDIIHVTFADNTVANCQYRHANEEEFNKFKNDSRQQGQ